jgi:hypothetical protein
MKRIPEDCVSLYKTFYDDLSNAIANMAMLATSIPSIEDDVERIVEISNKLPNPHPKAKLSDKDVEDLLKSISPKK